MVTTLCVANSVHASASLVMSMGASIRVLCLHGKGGSAQSFQQRLQPLIVHLSDVYGSDGQQAHFTFANAPHLIKKPPGSGSGSVGAAEAYEWWRLPEGERSFTAARYGGAEESVAMVESLLWGHGEEGGQGGQERMGGFDVVVGHSQGAMLLSVVLARRIASLANPNPNSNPNPNPYPSASCSTTSCRPLVAILSSPAWPLPYKDTIASLSNLAEPNPNPNRNPSSNPRPAYGLRCIFTVGAADLINPPAHTREIAGHFRSALSNPNPNPNPSPSPSPEHTAVQVLEHAGGHVLPTDPQSLAFLDRHVFSGLF